MKLGRRFGILLTFFLISSIPIEASVQLSVMPVEGGSSLDFGRLDGSLERNQSLRVRISSSVSGMYQVFQRLENPFTNEQGVSISQGILMSYAVNGSNAAGTLYAQANESLGPSEQLIYTSAPDGQSDTFTISYSIDQNRINATGRYLGRLSVIVRTMGAGNQDQVILPLTFEVASAFESSVGGSAFPDRIQINPQNSSLRDAQLEISFKGNLNGAVEIYQQLTVVPVNEQMQSLPGELMIEGNGIKDTLKVHEQLLWNTNQEDGKVNFQIQLKSPQEAAIPAGTYRGQMRVEVKHNQQMEEFPLALEVVIPPVFQLQVDLPLQGVRFDRVLPHEPPQEKEVIVRVQSNIGRPYMVVQKVNSSLVSSQGDSLKPENFIFQSQLLNGAQGHAGVSQWEPVGVGDKTVYYSDRKGSQAGFKVLYRLKADAGISAGEYAVPVVFSLVEL